MATDAFDDSTSAAPPNRRRLSIFRRRTSSLTSGGRDVPGRDDVKPIARSQRSSPEPHTSPPLPSSPPVPSTETLHEILMRVHSHAAVVGATDGATPPLVLTPRRRQEGSAVAHNTSTPQRTSRSRSNSTSGSRYHPRISHSPPPALPAIPSGLLGVIRASPVVMPPKSAKSKARAEGRKDRKAASDASKDNAGDAAPVAPVEDTSQSVNGDDDDDASDGEGFEDAQGGDEPEPEQQDALPSSASKDEKENANGATSENGDVAAAAATEQKQPVGPQSSEQPAVTAVKDASETIPETPELAVAEPATATEQEDVTEVAPAIETPSIATPQAEAATTEATPPSSSVPLPSNNTPPSEASAQLPHIQTSIAEPSPVEDQVPTPTAAETPIPAQPPPPPARKQSQSSSLWDRLKSPAERAAADREKASSPASASPPTTAPPLSRRPSQAASSFLNSITSAANYAATSAASRGFQLPERLGGGAAAAASLAPNAEQRKRLPRHQVDESKMMEDQMRFAEARHLLATSKDLEQIRRLGKDLEVGWREKLAEVTELHVKMEDLTHSVSDIEDENNQLRLQMAALSEQIVHREEDFESFQRLTVAHQEREKELWKEEGREEKEQLEWREREAVRILAEERAINAQLRIVLFGSLKEGGAGADGKSTSSHTGALEKGAGRLSLMPGGAGDLRRRTAVFDESTELAESPSDSQSPALERTRDSRDTTTTSSHRSSLAGAGGGESEDSAVQDDILFNLNLPHTSTGSNSTTSTRDTSRDSTTASLFSDVVPLDQLKLLLRLDATGDQIEPEDSSVSSLLPTRGTLNPLENYLLVQKALADSQLTQAIQLENFSLRNRFRDEEKRSRELEEELSVMRQRVSGMEAAIDGMLNGGGQVENGSV